MSTLVELQEFKDYEGISSSEFDSKLTTIIEGVTELVTSYCNRKFIIDETYVQYNNGGDSYIDTEQFPIATISSVEFSSDYGQTYTTLSEFTDYIHDKAKDSIYLLGDDGVELPNKYRVSYTAGYEVLPADLRLAIMDIIKYYYKTESVPKRMSNFVSIEYVNSSDFPSHIKRVLDLYRSL